MAEIVPVALPGLPEIELGLINQDFPTGPLPADVMHAVLARPAYWAFCWGSGLALARLLLDDPSWVEGKTVVDLGSGSGIVAIAAARAGAANVIACDTDANARLATAANADFNEVRVDITASLPSSCDLLLMADVLYDAANLQLLLRAQAHALEVLLADTRVSTLPDPRYREIARIDARTFPNLGEFDEFKTAHIFHFAG